MKLAAVVLAAGSARRFGSDKLSARLDGVPLLHHAIRAACAAPVERVIVVTRPGLEVGAWEGSPPVERHEIASDALSLSLQTGIAAVDGCEGAFVFLGDMPHVPHDVAGRLTAALGDNFAAIPRHQGRAGHPVLLSARAFGAIATLTGDEGAGRLLKQRTDIGWVDCEDPGVLLDIDRPEDLDRLRASPD